MRLRLRVLTVRALTLPLALIAGLSTLAGHTDAAPLHASAYYMPLDNDPQPITDITAGSGLRQLVLSFVVMAFDYGGPGGAMADDVRKVMEDAHAQLAALRPDLSSDEIYARTGLTLMNGHTDQPSELFTQDTFTSLLGYATDHHLARLSFWSLNRDRECTGTPGWVDGKYSGVSQQPYDFARIIARYAG